MTKKDLEKRVGELEELVNHQKKMIDMLYIHAPIGVTLNYSPNVDDSTCPMGGMHNYKHSSAGWTCICGKTLPMESFPSTTSLKQD